MNNTLNIEAVSQKDFERKILLDRLNYLKQQSWAAKYHGQFILLGSKQGVLCVSDSKEELLKKARRSDFLVNDPDLKQETLTVRFKSEILH